MTLSYRNIKNGASKNYITYNLPGDLPLIERTEGDMAFVTSVNSLYIYSDGWQAIRIQNEVPELLSVPPATVSIPIGATYSFTLDATDPDGLEIIWSYQIISGSASVNVINLNDNQFSFSALDDTVFTVRFKASDTVNEVTVDTEFTITNQPPSAPTLLSNGGVTANIAIADIGSLVNYQFTSTDPEGSSVTFSATPSASDDVSLINYSVLGDTLSVIANRDSVGPLVFDVTASDGKYTATTPFNITRTAPYWDISSNGYQDRVEAASTTDPFNRFGDSLDSHKDYLIVGAYNDDDNPSGVFSPQNHGTAWVYKYDSVAGTYSLEQQLTSPNVPSNAVGTIYGHSVAIGESVAFVSAHGHDGGNGVNSGSVEIFTRSGVTWTHAGQLLAPSPAAQNKYGYTLAYHPNNDGTTGRLVVTAPGNNTVYVYGVSGSTCTLNQTITGPNYPGTTDPVTYNEFGNSVAIHHNTLAIGVTTRNQSPGVWSIGVGAVCIYQDSGSGFVFEDVKYGTATTYRDNYADPGCVSVYRDAVMVGARNDNQTGTGSGPGAVWIFEKVNNTWTQTFTKAGAVNTQQEIGRGVALYDKCAVTNQIDAGITNKPIAWHFRKSGSTWASNQQVSYLVNTPADTDTNWHLNGATIDWDKIIMGGDHTNPGGGEGIFYLFKGV
jgi:hypothetical protein